MNNLLVILLGPLLAAVGIGLSRRRAGLWAIGGTSVSLVAVILGFRMLANGMAITLQLPGLPGLQLLLRLTPLTVIFSLVVALVSLIVTVYATGYMSSSTEKPRFFAIFLGFIAAMQGFILSGDVILLLVTWELMTVTSYLLIGFERRDDISQSAATRAFLTVRVGDIALYLAVFVYIAAAGTNNLAAMQQITGGHALAIGLLLLVAALVKAGQVPFGGWLRGAMAGPTPVSALLHSATMVAAGAILLIRFLPLLPPGAKLAVGVVGGVTTIIAGFMAIVQTDLKRLLAASTSSQIGLMFIGVASGSPLAATMHFSAHAFMKSTLFMGAGIFKHDRRSTDFKKLQGVGRQQPWVFVLFGFTAAALAGLPPMAGFVSKGALVAFSSLADKPWLVLLVLASTFLTGNYMAVALRQLYEGEGPVSRVSPGSATMIGALIPLVIFVAGYGLFVGSAAQFLQLSEVSNARLAIIDVLAAILGLGAGFYVRLPGGLRRGLLQLSEVSYLERFTALPVVRLSEIIAQQEIILTRKVYNFGSSFVRLAERTQSQFEVPLSERYFSEGRKLQSIALRTGQRIQTGLVHRELALSFGAMAATFVFIGIIIIIGGR